MALKLPPGYVDLFTAATIRDVDINVIGVVTDYLPPSRSKGNDWMCSFSITDDSNRGYREYGDGLKVRFFRPIEAELPPIQNLGDLVVIRNIRAKDWSGMTILLSNRITTWVVFPMSSIPEKLPTNNIQLKQKKGIRTPPPTNSEIQYVISLCNSQDRSSFKIPVTSNESTNLASNSNMSKSTASRQKFSLIKDLKVDMYYDLIGEVVKIFTTNGRCELYLSDYTSNNLLYNYEWGRTDGEDVLDGDACGHISRVSKKWQGPLGKMSLLVTLWSPHSEFAQEKVKEKDFIHLRNVHARRRDGSTLEGSLHTDRRYPDRVDVTILKDHEDDRVKDVLKRKRDYNKKFTDQSGGFVTEVREHKRKLGDDFESTSKNPPRKRPKQRKQKGKRKQNDTSADDEKSQDKLTTINFLEHKLNKNITCTHPSVPSRSVSSILSLDTTHAHTTPNHQDCILPFQNIRFKATVRAIGYFPPKLEDFAVPHRVTEFDALDDGSASENDGGSIASNGSQTSRQEVMWEWRFGLFLEDSSSGAQKPEKRDWMRVYVANQDADFLLKMDAVDLRNDPIALSQLREKLFILWGDLEERKTQAQERTPVDETKKCASPETNLVDKLLPSSEEKQSTDKSRNEICQKPSQTPAFQCCIKEYGIRVPKRELRTVGGRGEELQAAMKEELDDSGQEEDEEEAEFSWQRSFQMFGTTIK